MNNMYKSKKGITLVALVITIIILLILAGISIASLNGKEGILTKAKKTKTISEIADIKEQIQTDIIAKQMENEGKISDYLLSTILGKYGKVNYNEDGVSIKSVTTSKGSYEIELADIWSGTTSKLGPTVLADGSWTGTVNSPKIEGTGLTAVYYNGTSWVDLTEESSQEEWDNWYSYTTDKKQWANARSKDGSMWVWIPRYEYQIDSQNKVINIKFVKIGSTEETGYTLHPAFGTDKNNGGWRSELPGFWIAKYVAGFQNATNGENTKNVQYSGLKYTTIDSSYPTNFFGKITVNDTALSYPVFKADTYAYNLISVGDSWLLSREIGTADMYGLRNVDSHLEKNSEWGAVAYLTHSQYGINESSSGTNELKPNNKDLNNDIYVNNDTTTGTKANIHAVTSYGQQGTPNDVNASSTKNMTGVFDLSGCTGERTACFLQGGESKNVNWYKAMISGVSQSTEYLTLYTENNKIGDATNETSGWNSDSCKFLTSSAPIFLRGGNYTNVSSARNICL